MTFADLLASSLRLIGVLESGEVPDGNEAQDGLVAFNQMLDAWSADEITVFSVVPTAAAPFVAGKQAYSIGPGGDVNIARPPRIERVTSQVLSNPAQPLELPMDYLTFAGWSEIPVKSIQSSQPTKVFDDQAFPLRNLNFWPVYSGASYAVNFIMYVWAALSQAPDLVTDLAFPPAYLKALRYNLAIDLAPEYSASVSVDVRVQAMESLKKIAIQNAQPIDLKCDPAIVGTGKSVYNWLSDTYGRGY